MRHFASAEFWRAYARLPENIRAFADKNYALLKQDPMTDQSNRDQLYWSVRVGAHHRALGIDIEDGVLWFWIGSHADYDRLLG